MLKEFLRKWLGVAGKQLSKGDVYISGFTDTLRFNLSEAMNAFDQNVWVNAAVNLRSEVFANVKLYLKDKNDKKVTNHPVLDLLNRPNEYITRFNIMQLVSMHCDLTGNAFWKYDMEGTKIVRIWPLIPQNVSFINKPGEFVGGYKYNLNGKVLTFTPEEVTHFIKPNPNSLLNGSAPIFSAAYAIDTEKQSNNWNYNFFKNGGSVGNVLQYDGNLDEEVRQRVREQFDSRHKGDKKAFKTIFLEGGLKLNSPEISQKDMEFSQLQITNRDKVIGVYRVPKILLAQFEGGSLAEARTAENIFAKYTITPIIKSFVETLNLDLLPLYGIKDQSLSLDFEPIVSIDKGFELQKDDAALNKWMTINERRQQEGYEPIDGGDVLYQPLSQVPINYTTSEEPASSNKSTNIQSDIPVIEYKRKKVHSLLKNNDAAFRKEYKKKFLISHINHETKFVKKLKNVFAKQKKETLEKLKKHKNYTKTKSLTNDIFDKPEEIKKFFLTFSPLVYDIATENANEVNMFFGLGVQGIENLPNLNNAVKKMTMKFATEINTTTEDILKDQLAEGLANGESIDNIAKRVKGVFKEASTNRSVMIARTETTKASTMGALETYDASNVVNGKQWLTVIDGRERPDHGAADGQTVKLNQKFDVGDEELVGPGLGNDAGNNINCRCNVLPVII